MSERPRRPGDRLQWPSGARVRLRWRLSQCAWSPASGLGCVSWVRLALTPASSSGRTGHAPQKKRAFAVKSSRIAPTRLSPRRQRWVCAWICMRRLESGQTVSGVPCLASRATTDASSRERTPWSTLSTYSRAIRRCVRRRPAAWPPHAALPSLQRVQRHRHVRRALLLAGVADLLMHPAVKTRCREEPPSTGPLSSARPLVAISGALGVVSPAAAPPLLPGGTRAGSARSSQGQTACGGARGIQRGGRRRRRRRRRWRPGRWHWRRLLRW